jgi:ElaB/YqjD/DUF883 family membrane-anchored ribosome-binding protein
VGQRTDLSSVRHQTAFLLKEKAMSERFATQKVQLIDDLKTVVSDVQDLVRASSSDGSEALKQSVTDQLAKAMDRLHRLEDHAAQSSRIPRAVRKPMSKSILFRLWAYQRPWGCWSVFWSDVAETR